MQGYSAGFEVNIAGTEYSEFLISGAGYIYLGNGEIDYNNMMQANFMTYDGDYTCFGLGVNRGVTGFANTVISYQVTGSGADSRLVVQYENLGLCYNFWDSGAPVDFQLVVSASGEASIVFKDFAALEAVDATVSLYAGLRQGGAYVSAGGECGNLELQRNSRGDALFSASSPAGETLVFTAPAPCVVPSAGPTDLQFVCTSNSVAGAFTAATDADTYLVVYGRESSAEKPADGTVYAKGDKLGDATVAYCGPETSFSVSGLEGGCDYVFTVWATNSYGTDGPVYNTTSPLSETASTLPAPAEAVAFDSATLESITMNIASNAAGDDVVVMYNTYCLRDSYGDHGYFITPAADAAVGDVVPVADDFEPYWDYEGAPMPENAGVVAYAGKADGPLTVTGLEPSTGYYFVVYTRNAAGEYTSQPVYTGYSTYLSCPYDGDSYNFARFEMPCGWTTSETGAETFSFRNEAYYSFSTKAPTQGTQIVQQRAQLTQGNAVDGKTAWMQVAPVAVTERHCQAKFDYCITAAVSRFETTAYNEWADDDVLEIQVSDDLGESWVPLQSYTADSHPEQEETLSYVSIAADLNDYRGKTVLVRLYWKTFATNAFGTNMYVDRFSLSQMEFPAVPDVTVSQVTHNSALVSWVSQQTDYELAYGVCGSDDPVVVTIEGASSYMLEGLEVETEYEVRVRGILEGDEAYSEWSDPVVFSTAGWPAIDAPVNLSADTETYAEKGGVALSWDAVEEALSYEVAYRLSSSTEWIYEPSDEASLVVEGLEHGSTYVWKVRAFCTHDRETEFSAQGRFTIPELSGVASATTASATVKAVAGGIEIAGAAGLTATVITPSGVSVKSVTVAAECEIVALSPGLYIVKIGDSGHKVSVR